MEKQNETAPPLRNEREALFDALQLAYKRLVDGAEGDGTSLTNAQCALLLDRFVYLEDTMSKRTADV